MATFFIEVCKWRKQYGKSSKTEIFNIIMQVNPITYAVFCRPSHSQGEGITQGMNTRRWRTLGTILESAHHQDRILG